MDIFPAIDLLDSKAVRLTKGKKDSAKVYGAALDFAKFFEDCGARWIHIVDLDGAFNGSPRNLEVIESIANHTTLHIQVGGGIRDEDSIKRYLAIGVHRVILGSVALQNPQWSKDMSLKYPIAISIDSIDGMVATHGWVNVSSMEAVDFAKSFRGTDVRAIICTDISRDGLLSGMNFDLAGQIRESSGIYTIVSGGFSGIDDINNARLRNDIDAIIIGKAFYEGKIDFKTIRF